jgi:hypothetical protein
VLHVQGSGQDANDKTLKFDQTTGWVMSYSAEYDTGLRGDGEAFLSGLAKLTGGRSLKENTDAVFSHNLTTRSASTSVWPWLLLAAVLLLPVDIAVRRLVVTRTDLIRLRRALFERKRVEATSERLSSLMTAKERGRQRAEESGGSVKSATLGSSTVEPVASDKPRYTPSINKQSPTAKSDANVAGRLLKKRKERRGDE